MRLTLRTLLAYLDDTLEPAEARAIGQKVAESDAAQEMIARIKEVTRRRRLTTPSSGAPGDKVDPNTIAGYLDNALTPEALAEVEQLALTSDVHLAEIAACHQILTIVLGEPAMVPPTAYKRMYGLVKPPESNPQHQPPVRREAEEELTNSKDEDHTLRLGLPAVFGQGSWTNRLVLIGGAACVLALLVVSIVLLLLPTWQRGPDEQAKLGTGKGAGNAKSLLPDLGHTAKDKGLTKPDLDTASKKPADVKDKPPPGKDATPEAKDILPPEKEKLPAEKEKTPVDEPPAPPNLTVAEVGQFDSLALKQEAVLLQLTPDKKQPDHKHWVRLLRGKEPARVLSNLPLVSLPGYRSVVTLDSGARLLLWGNAREISPFPLAVESVVTLHPNKLFELDLTLVRGRIAVTNTRDQPLKTRLRFANPANPGKDEVWDITLLEKGTEVIVNLAGLMPPGEPFYPKPEKSRVGPIAAVVLLVHAGSASLKVDLQPVDKLLPPPQGPLVVWDSRTGKINQAKVEAMPAWVQPLPPLPKEIDPKSRAAVLTALDNLSKDLTGANPEQAGQSIDKGLMRALGPGDMEKRRLAVRCASAIDDLQRVIDVLKDNDLEMRQTAIETLRIWIGAARDNDYVLFQQLQSTYSPDDSQIVMTLLHRWAPAQDADKEIRDLLVNYLMHPKVAIRELAHDYLLSMPDLFQQGIKIGYNAVAPEDQRRQRAMQWQALVQGKVS